jgi:hypothetical protein
VTCRCGCWITSGGKRRPARACRPSFRSLSRVPLSCTPSLPSRRSEFARIGSSYRELLLERLEWRLRSCVGGQARGRGIDRAAVLRAPRLGCLLFHFGADRYGGVRGAGGGGAARRAKERALIGVSASRRGRDYRNSGSLAASCQSNRSGLGWVAPSRLRWSSSATTTLPSRARCRSSSCRIPSRRRERTGR